MTKKDLNINYGKGVTKHMNIVQIIDGNHIVNAVLLSRFNMNDSYPYNQRTRLGKVKNDLINIKRNYCLVFIPWKHREKELRLVLMENVIHIADLCGDDIVTQKEFISTFVEEKPYVSEIKVSCFTGYDFVYRNSDFIANVRNQCYEKSICILYKELPELLTLDVNNFEE